MLALTQKMVRAAQNEDWDAVSRFSANRQRLISNGLAASDTEFRDLIEENNRLTALVMEQRAHVGTLLRQLKSGKRAARAYDQAQELSGACETNPKEV